MSKLPQKEAEIVEFQSTFNDSVIETLVAFSNAKGGTVYIGISEEGEIQGITLNIETIAQWIDTTKSQTTPEITPEYEILNVDDKQILLMRVPENSIKPVAAKGRYIKRIGSLNHYLNAEEIANEFFNHLTGKQDSMPISNREKKRRVNLKRNGTANRQKIVELIATDSRTTIKKIAKKLGLTAKGVEKSIRILKADGIIKRIGPDKGGIWVVDSQ